MNVERLAQRITEFYKDPRRYARCISDPLRANPALLGGLLKEKPHLIQHLKNKALEGYWADFILHFKPTHQALFRFRPQAVLDNADIAIGYLYYSLSIDSRESNKDIQADYCINALTHHSYHALSHLIYTMILQLNDASFEAAHTRLTQFLTTYQNRFTIHRGPGFLLAAYAFYMASKTLDKEESEALKINLFKKALQFIHLAEASFNTSKAEFSNAYLGQSFSSAHPFHLFHLETIADTKAFFKKEALGLLTPVEFEQTLDDAKRRCYQLMFEKLPSFSSFDKHASTIKAILLGETSSLGGDLDFSQTL